jgi:hypothetical protein
MFPNLKHESFFIVIIIKYCNKEWISFYTKYQIVGFHLQQTKLGNHKYWA